MTSILLIDNYDSFTYNLVHYFGEMGADVTVVRNDAVDMQALESAPPSGIVISPGPGTPDDSGFCQQILRDFGHKIPVFGVCLGHQTIGQVFGGKVIRTTPLHGKTSLVFHESKGIFKDIPSPFTATRYHSLIVERESLPDCLEITAWTEDGIIMGLQHKEFPIHGVQFHPESIASEHGHALIKHFLECIS